MNYTELNIAKEIIPQYEGGSKIYHIIFNNPKNLLTCFKIRNKVRKIALSIDYYTRFVALNRFGDCRNENLLENDLITCFQFTNESYQDYYERIRTKLQCPLEQININEDNEPLKNYKIQIFNKKALATYLSGLVEPYYSFMNYHTVNSLEECLLKLKHYDNHRQQANFMNFMRHKGQNKQNYKPINNYQKLQEFKPHQNNLPNFNPQNASRQFNYNPQITKELFNINEGHNDSEPIQDDFEDRLVDYNEDLIEADKNDESNYSESPVNFRIPVSEELTST
ncbi:hypothetical protein FQA39_LY12408 [Lamprigera yunnana]|nr:hypothetical protein FQA39_LY12408 [Lamprigera yunnana]